MLAPLWSPERAAKRRRTGGWRQQRAREAPDDDDTHDMSHLAAGHLLEWCDGVESATQVRDHMRNAIRDRIGHPMVKRFSDIGGSGHNGQHCHQGLMRLLGKCGIHKCITPLPSPSDVSSVLLPSTLIRLLYERYPSMFRIRLGANERMIVKFWTQFLARAENAKWAATHPALRGKLPIELRLTVPCSMHEDAGPISKLSSADCVSWSSIVWEGDEKVTHLLSWSYIKSKSSSLDKSYAWDVFLKDWEALATGFVDGQAVARHDSGEVWSFALMFAKADEETRCNAWGLTHWQSADECCTECLANRSNRPFTDLRGVAAWRGSAAMPTEHYVARARQPLHPFMASPFFTRWACFPDLMHMMDCKGVTAVVLGGILHILPRDARVGPNQNARLALINAKLKEWYDDHPGSNRMPRILLNNVTADGWADIHGPAIKAACTRSAVGPFRAIWNEYKRADSRYHTDATSVIDNLAEFYNILYAAPMFMPAESICKLNVACTDFGAAYLQCREHARAAGALAWPVRMKMHKMMHVPLMCRVINPVFVQRYAEESLIGTTAKVYKKSIAGRYHNVAQRNVLVKRLVALLLRFHDYELDRPSV